MAEKHFHEQKEFTQKYLLPYFQKYIPDLHRMSVLEVGCAEGGLLEALNTNGIESMGIELNPERIQIAYKKNYSLNIIQGDITDPQLYDKIGREYDLIIMREVIEHVFDKEAAFNNLDKLLKKGGYLYISFPPKYSPFAGHQQIAKSYLKVIPYLHLFPTRILKSFAKYYSEDENFVDEIKLHYKTGMKIGKFEELCSMKKFIPVKKELFLFRPIYGFRFGLPKIKLPNIPLIREVISFGYEVLLKKVG